MIYIKKDTEVQAMKNGGKILTEVLFEVLNHVKPGVSEIELDLLAEKLIKEKGAEPGFKRVKGYRHSICTSTNDVVVHGVPTNYILKAGDVIGIDCGLYYKGFHTDMAETIRVIDNKNHEFDAIDDFLAVGKSALDRAIEQAKIDNRVGNISKTIQEIVEANGYSVVRSLVGHGVGKSLHEEPEIPGFLSGSISQTPLLVSGMTIAIEVIYNMGRPDVIYANDDGWTIKTQDGSISGVFERTIAITANGSIVLTQ